MNEVASKTGPVVDVAALQNTDPHWFTIFDKCGIQIVVVHLITKRGSPVHDHPEIEKALGLELQEIEAGFYDSSWYPGCIDDKASGSVWHQYHVHVHHLGKAMARLKEQLGVRGLLEIANILHGEAHNQFRIWWSYDPDIIGKLVESTIEL